MGVLFYLIIFNGQMGMQKIGSHCKETSGPRLVMTWFLRGVIQKQHGHDEGTKVEGHLFFFDSKTIGGGPPLKRVSNF